MNEIINLIGLAIYWILPAYIANGVPVIFGGGAPLDFGKKLVDGHRIFGDGKTIRGTFIGILLGSLVGFLSGRLWVGILLAIGAIVGDLIGSFLKRRWKKKCGHPVGGLDQFDFLIGALVFASIVEIPQLNLLIAVLIITPLLHLGTNYLAYKLKLKKVWW